MNIWELLADLRLDLGDADETLLGDDYLRRCILKAVPAINKDINRSICGDTIFIFINITLWITNINIYRWFAVVYVE